MNRRNFLKKIGVTCATVVAAPAALVKVKPKITDRSVLYGQAMYNYPKGFLMLSTGTGLPWRKMGYIYVKALEPIKKDQAIIWYLNGTISGAL